MYRLLVKISEREHLYIQRNGFNEIIGGSDKCQQLFLQEEVFPAQAIAGLDTKYKE